MLDRDVQTHTQTPPRQRREGAAVEERLLRRLVYCVFSSTAAPHSRSRRDTVLPQLAIAGKIQLAEAPQFESFFTIVIKMTHSNVIVEKTVKIFWWSKQNTEWLLLLGDFYDHFMLVVKQAWSMSRHALLRQKYGRRI